jgi:type I restriction enzyme R subunit
VDLARDVFGRGDAFVQKITGRVDRPLQRIREFRNRANPGIVVTVDLLTTGIDIPDLEYLVFLRPVKSRILFEQMLGRGTRKGDRFPDKSHFTVFDCFDGTLLEYFCKATGITAEPPDRPTRTNAAVIEDIWQNRDRDYNVRCLVKRLQRIDKQMAGTARDQFAAFIPAGDVGQFAASLARKIKDNFTATWGSCATPPSRTCSSTTHDHRACSSSPTRRRMWSAPRDFFVPMAKSGNLRITWSPSLDS